MKQLKDALNGAWGENPRPEIKSTFYLGVAEGAYLAKQTNAESVVELAALEIKLAHAELRELPWWRRWFIKA